MSPRSPFDSHVVLFTAGMWGHTRPMCSFAARLILSRSKVVVTFMTAPGAIQKSEEEVSRYFPENQATLQENIRFRALPNGIGLLKSEMEGVADDFAKDYEALISEDLPFPAVFIAEVTLSLAHEIVRARSKGITKLISWCPFSLSISVDILLSLGETSMDTIIAGLQLQSVQEGKSYQELAYNYFAKSLKGTVTSPPDMPAISDYELFPQELADAKFTPRGEIILGALQTLSCCDGVIGVASKVLEPSTSTLLDSMLAARGASFFNLGPLIPSFEPTFTHGSLAQKGEFAQSASESKEVEEFLERMLKERGGKSVLYISFGSQFFPPEPPKFWAFLEAVVAKNIPFILADLGRHPQLPDHLLAVATGFFLSHCGINGTLESLSAGVPMICWPIFYDQPHIAITVTQVLHCGFELSEVRRGLGLQYRASTGKTASGTVEAVKAEALDILEKAFSGVEGKVVRETVLQVSEKLGKAWGTGGDALKDLHRFIDKHLPTAD